MVKLRASICTLTPLKSTYLLLIYSQQNSVDSDIQSSLYSDSESLYLDVKRQISLDAIRRATCAIFSATHFKQVTRAETTRLTLDCS